jgi:hypothetical protein
MVTLFGRARKGGPGAGGGLTRKSPLTILTPPCLRQHSRSSPPVPGWRNWQTRMVEGHVGETL